MELFTWKAFINNDSFNSSKFLSLRFLFVFVLTFHLTAVYSYEVRIIVYISIRDYRRSSIRRQ